MNITETNLLLKIKGWALLPQVLEAHDVQLLQRDLDRATDRCRSIQVRNGLGGNTHGSAHHIIGSGDSLDEFLRKKILFDLVRSYFGGPFILNTFSGFINHPDSTAYVCNIHRDVRSFSREFPLMLNMLVMLDDFTAENGATYALSGSHMVPDRPSDEFFYRHSERFLGNAGDIVLFDSNLWHSAGPNRSNHVRRALTICYSRPFMKQQLDYTRYLGPSYIESLDDELKQVVGMYARVPSSHDEWYQPPAQRFYHANQG